MKTTLTLELKTREAHHLFTRKIKGERLFVDVILHKLNKITGQKKKSALSSEETYQTTKWRLSNLTQYFEDETKKLLQLTQKNSFLKNKPITVKAQFFPQVRLDNPLIFELVKLIQQYDTLISAIKILHLAGCFENNQTYYESIQRIQGITNRTLSQIIITQNV